MNIELIVIGKTDSKEITALVEMYTKRINFYNRFTITYIPDIRNNKSLTEAQQKTAEGEAILRLIETSDRVVLLAYCHTFGDVVNCYGKYKHSASL